jgi:hypothetical protein
VNKSIEGLDEAIKEVNSHGFGISLQIDDGGYFEFSIWGRKFGNSKRFACESASGNISNNSVPMRIIEALLLVEGTI